MGNIHNAVTAFVAGTDPFGSNYLNKITPFGIFKLKYYCETDKTCLE